MILALHPNDYSLYGLIDNFDRKVDRIKEDRTFGKRILRLKLFKMVPDELVPGKDSSEWQALLQTWQTWLKVSQPVSFWKALLTAGKAVQKAYEADEEAWEWLKQIWEVYESKFNKELEALHDKLCLDCPWDGYTIFSAKYQKGMPYWKGKFY